MSIRKEIVGLHRITKKHIKVLCKEQKLYQTPHLNEQLYLHFQGFQCIENLEEYTGLKCLWLESNAISEIQGLESQTELKCLFLQNNLIRKIENLQCCPLLDTFNLSSNHITKIENCGVEVLPHLSTLNLSRNCLRNSEDLRELLNCKSLWSLDLSHNRIDDILVVKIFANLPELRVLILEGNPVVSKVPQYRKTLTLECKNLTFLDSRPIFPKDRACAEAWKRGGFEEEQKERNRWDQKDRHKIIDSVNATLRLRQKHGDGDIQLLKYSDDENEEKYSKREKGSLADLEITGVRKDSTESSDGSSSDDPSCSLKISHSKNNIESRSSSVSSSSSNPEADTFNDNEIISSFADIVVNDNIIIDKDLCDANITQNVEDSPLDLFETKESIIFESNREKEETKNIQNSMHLEDLFNEASGWLFESEQQPVQYVRKSENDAEIAKEVLENKLGKTQFESKETADILSELRITEDGKELTICESQEETNQNKDTELFQDSTQTIADFSIPCKCTSIIMQSTPAFSKQKMVCEESTILPSSSSKSLKSSSKINLATYFSSYGEDNTNDSDVSVDSNIHVKLYDETEKDEACTPTKYHKVFQSSEEGTEKNNENSETSFDRLKKSSILEMFTSYSSNDLNSNFYESKSPLSSEDSDFFGFSDYSTESKSADSSENLEENEITEDSNEESDMESVNLMIEHKNRSSKTTPKNKKQLTKPNISSSTSWSPQIVQNKENQTRGALDRENTFRDKITSESLNYYESGLESILTSIIKDTVSDKNLNPKAENCEDQKKKLELNKNKESSSHDQKSDFQSTESLSEEEFLCLEDTIASSWLENFLSKVCEEEKMVEEVGKKESDEDNNFCFQSDSLEDTIASNWVEKYLHENNNSSEKNTSMNNFLSHENIVHKEIKQNLEEQMKDTSAAEEDGDDNLRELNEYLNKETLEDVKHFVPSQNPSPIISLNRENEEKGINDQYLEATTEIEIEIEVNAEYEQGLEETFGETTNQHIENISYKEHANKNIVRTDIKVNRTEEEQQSLDEKICTKSMCPVLQIGLGEITIEQEFNSDVTKVSSTEHLEDNWWKKTLETARKEAAAEAPKSTILKNEQSEDIKELQDKKDGIEVQILEEAFVYLENVLDKNHETKIEDNILPDKSSEEGNHKQYPVQDEEVVSGDDISNQTGYYSIPLEKPNTSYAVEKKIEENNSSGSELPQEGSNSSSTLREVITTFNIVAESMSTHHQNKSQVLRDLIANPLTKTFSAQTGDQINHQVQELKREQRERISHMIDRVYAQRDKYDDTLEVVNGRLMVIKRATGALEELPPPPATAGSTKYISCGVSALQTSCNDDDSNFYDYTTALSEENKDDDDEDDIEHHASDTKIKRILYSSPVSDMNCANDSVSLSSSGSSTEIEKVEEENYHHMKDNDDSQQRAAKMLHNEIVAGVMPEFSKWLQMEAEGTAAGLKPTLENIKGKEEILLMRKFSEVAEGGGQQTNELKVELDNSTQSFVEFGEAAAALEDIALSFE